MIDMNRLARNEHGQIVDRLTGEIVRMDMPVYKNQANAAYFPKNYEKNTGSSRTVPNLSMTILEMIQRHRRGLPIDESKGALYQGDELLPNIDWMDEIDKAAYIDSVADRLVEVRAKIENTAKTVSERKFLARVEEQVKAELKKLAEDAQRNKVTDVKPE